MKSIIVEPVKHPLKGSLQIPGDKSISHRAIIFASLSEGKTRIYHLLEAEDVLCTLDCFRAMGVKIEKEENDWCVEGVGLKGLKKPSKVLWCGNSGTAMRLLLGVLAAQDFESSLTGDASLNKRPMNRVTEPLTQMGAHFGMEGEGTEKRIVHVKGGNLKGIHYKSPVASAQIKSAVLLAGLWAKGETSIEEPNLSRDHTEQMFLGSAVSLKQSQNSVTLKSPLKILFPPEFTVPGDISSAAFFLVAALLVPGARITLQNIGINPTRSGIIEALQAMGASIQIENEKNRAGEKVGDLKVHSSNLKGIKIQGDIIPRLIDEIPILGVAASFAKGTTEISNAEELRVKESDRIKVLAHLLTQIGVSVSEKQDGLIMEGSAGKAFRAAKIQSYGDHRMAMSMAIAALVADGPIEIEDIDCVNTSFPSFWKSLSSLGVHARIP